MSSKVITTELELLRQRLEELEAKTVSGSGSSNRRRSVSPTNSSSPSRRMRRQSNNGHHSTRSQTPDTTMTEDSMMAHFSNDESEERQTLQESTRSRRSILKKNGTEFSHLSKSIRSLGARRMDMMDTTSEDDFGGSVDVHLGDDDSSNFDDSLSTGEKSEAEDPWLSIGKVNKFNQSFEDLDFPYDKFASLSMYDQPGSTTQRSFSQGEGSKFVPATEKSDNTEKKSNLGLIGLSSRQSSRRELLAETMRQNSRQYVGSSQPRRKSIPHDDPVEDEDQGLSRRSAKRTPLRLSIKSVSMQPQVGDDDDDDKAGDEPRAPFKLPQRRPPAVSDSMQPQPRTDSDDEEDDDVLPPVTRKVSIRKASPPRMSIPNKSSRRGLDMSHHQRMPSRDSAFDHCLPVNLTPSGAEPAVAASELTPSDDKKETDDLLTSFHQFALLTLDPNRLLELRNELLWEDEGPRNLDGFLLAEEAHVSDKFPADKPFSVSSQAMSSFCFPNGLRVRFVPRGALHGASRMGWTGSKGDERHILVFTNGEGRTDHGVALTVRWELPLTKVERAAVIPALKRRRKRRSAAVKITRWLRACSQRRMLVEALQIAGLDKIHTAEELRSELDASEFRLLTRALRHHHERASSVDGSLTSASTSGSERRKSKKVKNRLLKVLSRKSRKPKSDTPDTRSHDGDSEVEHVTRTAMMRSANSPTPVRKKLTAEDTVGNVTESPRRNRRFLLSVGDRMSSRQSLKSSRRGMVSGRSTPHTSSRDMVSSPSPTQTSRRSLTSKLRANHLLRNRAQECYDAMKELDKLGVVCIVEQCYTLVGCRPEDHALLMGPLQQLVDSDRHEILDARRQRRDRKHKGGTKTSETAEERQLTEKKVAERRHVAIRAMQNKLRLTVDQALVSNPKSQWEFITESRQFFEASIPQIPDSDHVKLPLPLPRVGKEWALAKLLREVGPDPLVLLLKLLLLERSILIVGERLEEVTAVACALLELIKPFEWASAFIPVLPLKLLDFVTSPVPFVAGVAANDKVRTAAIEKDGRVLEAMSNGMSLLNLSTATLHTSSEKGLSTLLSLDPLLREQLSSLQGRLAELAKNKRSALNSFERFVQRGLSLKESLTLHSVCLLFEEYFGRLCGDIAVDRCAYERYGTIAVHSGEGSEFIFDPDTFMKPIREAVRFQEAVVKTQLFMGYVEGRRQEHQDVKGEMIDGEVGQLVADWIYERWSIKKRQRKTNKPS